MEERLDKTVFKNQSMQDADRNVSYWRTRSPEERLAAAYHLSLRVFGYDPEDPPRMEKELITKRQRSRNRIEQRAEGREPRV